MEALSPAELGTILLVSFIPAFLARGFLERRFVLAYSPLGQPNRQLALDLVLCLSGGLFAGFWVEAVSGFPLVTGYKLLFGSLAGGFYIALELSLARERAVIREAEAKGMYAPPVRLAPMTRKFVAVAVTALLLTAVILGMIWANDVRWLTETAKEPGVLGWAKKSVISEIWFVIAVTIFAVVRLILLYSANLRLLFAMEISVLEKVSRGDLSQRAPVATADEFGLIAGHTNEMIAGLSHRMQLLDALKVAEEVQRNLLPAAPPDIIGLDIAAESRYCDETGGDYYDFFTLPDGKPAFAVGDVAGHGVGPALLMASARAYLRMAAGLDSDIGLIVTAVNNRVTEDVYGTGRFLTLFIFAIDPEKRSLCWVRAGHDPGLVYDPAADSFEELWGGGPPLGVVSDAVYELGQCTLWPPGGIVCVGTDGIWETRGKGREMFGKGRLREIIRKNADKPAKAIIAAVFEALEAFRDGRPVEDDVTITLIKFP